MLGVLQQTLSNSIFLPYSNSTHLCNSLYPPNWLVGSLSIFSNPSCWCEVISVGLYPIFLGDNSKSSPPLRCIERHFLMLLWLISTISLGNSHFEIPCCSYFFNSKSNLTRGKWNNGFTKFIVSPIKIPKKHFRFDRLNRPVSIVAEFPPSLNQICTYLDLI